MKLLILIFAHLLADYPLQGDFLASQKGKNLLLMMSHCGIWTGCVGVAAYLVGIHVGYGMLLFLFAGHFVADAAKATRQAFYAQMEPLGAALWIDQSIHLGQLLVLFFVGSLQ